MRKNEMFELTFENLPENGEIFGEFTWDGDRKTVPGFYAGEGVYKVRFLPMTAGEYRWRVTGAVSAQGEEACGESDAPGLVQAVGKTFRFADGGLFHPFGTTVYALISQTDELIEKTMQTLEKAPFNKIRMCVFPKDYDFNKNEPTYYPFEKNPDGNWNPARPIARDTLRLPEDRRYTIQILDTWRMTVETVARGVSGVYEAQLPGRENMALLALAEA